MAFESAQTDDGRVVKGRGRRVLVFLKTRRKQGSGSDFMLAGMTLTLSRLALTCGLLSHCALLSVMKSKDSGKGSHL